MNIKVSDYIVEYFADKGVERVFTVVGGGAMHLNDSFGHSDRVKCLYNHHEQASAMAAEGYAKVTGKPAICCVTGGPGGLNALNGIAGAYQDSIPMIVLCGQVKSTLLEKTSGLNLRTLGGQEFDIVSAVSKMTKYAETVLEASKIKWYLDKAYYTAISGRKGPCLLDIPIDIQGSFIDTDNLFGYDDHINVDKDENTNQDEYCAIIKEVADRLLSAKRPVIYAGNGIRLAGGIDDFKKFVYSVCVPVVTCWDSIDLIESDSEYYCGRAGTMGNRAGNFAVQNADFLLCIGNRLSIYQVGYDVSTWARNAFVVAVDIDENELKKPTIRVDLPICMDAGKFIRLLIDELQNRSSKAHDWEKQCLTWKKNYPVISNKQIEQENQVNVYAFIDILSKLLPESMVTVVANGSASVVGSNAYHIKKDSRFIMNCAISSMGWGLPASIGASVGAEDSCMYNSKPLICIEGDGSLMMNLQELQTVVTNNLPIKLFIINNNGYHQIRLTQNNIFNNGLVGVGKESGDLGFPDFKKIADAFSINYMSINDNNMIETVINTILSDNKPCICEVFVDTEQIFEPKSATRKLEDGTLVSPPLEDMAPFLSIEELKANMYIPIIEK